MQSLLVALMLTSATPLPAPADGVDRLGALLNQFRLEHGLPPVAVSLALTEVADAHVRDLEDNRPDLAVDSRGRPCNMHSWSAASGWTPVCYTPDHARAEMMWNKPREITRGRYTGTGFEIAARHSIGMDPDAAVALWRESPDHLDVILERGPWRGARWQAMGIGLDGQFAVVWFGKTPDNEAMAQAPGKASALHSAGSGN